MSTDSPASYRRLVTLTSLALVLVAVVLAAVGSRQAPRVRVGQVDGATAVQAEGAQLLLAPNQPSRAAGTLSVRTEPATPASVVERDGRFVVTFERPLRYGTTYTVSVGPVTGVHTGVTGRLRFTFDTPSPSLVTLHRSGPVDDGEPDRIVRVDDGEERTAFSATTILEYADAGSALVVSTLADDRVRLTRVGDDGDARSLDAAVPPGASLLRSLRADPRTGVFGFVAGTPGGGEDRLYLHDVAAPDAATEPVAGPDGGPMDVLGWMPIPGERQAVVQDTSGRIFLVSVDRPTAAPTPLGTYGRILGFVPGTSVLALPDNNSATTRLLDPLRGVSRTVPLPAPDAAGGGLLVQQWPLDGAGATLVLESVRTADGTSYRVSVLDGGHARPLLATQPGEADAVEVCPAPDGDHVAVVVEPTGEGSDGYPVQPSRTGVTTFVVGAHTSTTTQLDGAQPTWCSSGPTAASEGGGE